MLCVVTFNITKITCCFVLHITSHKKNKPSILILLLKNIRNLFVKYHSLELNGPIGPINYRPCGQLYLRHDSLLATKVFLLVTNVFRLPLGFPLSALYLYILKVFGFLLFLTASLLCSWQDWGNFDTYATSHGHHFKSGQNFSTPICLFHNINMINIEYCHWVKQWWTIIIRFETFIPPSY